MTYRPDIDGLRALAVLVVLFFHYGIGPFPGGFVGVDVFFVISGYLITSILLKDLSQQRFSIARFYERRVRRIFPALTGVLAATAIVGAVLLVPEDMQKLSQSLLATTAFASNVFFLRESGYFHPAAETRPLLHTWSLAVEEQFYIFFPLLLWALYRLSKRALAPALAVLALLSLALSAWSLPRAPAAVFYMLPYRAWELLLGALLALQALPLLRPGLAREGLAALGLGSIAWAAIRFSATTPFPGLHALAPTLGAALLIYTGEAGGTRVAALLGSRPLVAVGLISYSLYLWHWPARVFAKFALARDPTRLETWGLALLSGLLATASWRLLEQPFRRPNGVFTRRPLFLAAAGASAALAVFGLAGHLAKGYPGRLPLAVRQYADGLRDRDPGRAACSDQPLEQLQAGKLCALGVPSEGGPAFVAWGDSHAESIMPAFRALAEKHHVQGAFASRHDCPPLLGVERQDDPTRACAAFNAAVLRFVTTRQVRQAFLIGRWNLLLNGRPDYELRVLHEGQPYLAEAASTERSREMTRAVVRRGLERTLQALKAAGVRSWLVAEVPTAGMDTPRMLARYTQLGRDVRALFLPRADQLKQEALFRAELAPLASGTALRVLYPAQLLCDATSCRLAAEGRSLYRDTTHLTAFGARWIAALFEPAFAELAGAREAPHELQQQPGPGKVIAAGQR